MYGFSRKIFLMLHSINWPNSIVWLSLRIEMLDNVYITIVYLPRYDVINFEINLIYLIKSFFYMTKMSRKNFKYLEKKRICGQKFSQTWECAFKEKLPTDIETETAPLTELSSWAENIQIKTQKASENTDFKMWEFLRIQKVMQGELVNNTSI